MSAQTLPLRIGAPPPPPRWPGAKPKVHFWTGVVVAALGAALLAIGAATRAGRRSELAGDRMKTGGAMVVVGAALVLITQGGRSRQRRGRAALDAWAARSGFARPHPDVAEGQWRGAAVSLRLAYGSRHTQGDARAWLVQVGASPARGWVIVHDRLDAEPEIALRLARICDAAASSVQQLRG